jgi:hypothetical protein
MLEMKELAPLVATETGIGFERERKLWRKNLDPVKPWEAPVSKIAGLLTRSSLIAMELKSQSSRSSRRP